MRHYSKIGKVFIIDDHSTDNTVEIAKDYGAMVLPYPYEKEISLVEKDHSECFVDYFKQYSQEADWVMCVDTDEFIYDERLIEKLSTLEGIVKPEGYMMISDKLPGAGQIYDHIKTGVRMKQYDKPVILDPKLAVEFGDGRHSITSDVEPIQSDIKLLHYKYLTRSYYYQRSRDVYPRTDMTDQQRNYRLKRGLAWYDKHINIAKKVI